MGNELLSYFKLKNLPVYNKRSINLLEDPLIRSASPVHPLSGFRT